MEIRFSFCNSRLTVVSCSVIHVCNSVRAAQTDIPSILGEIAQPATLHSASSTMQPNTSNTIPQAIVVGGGFQDHEVDYMRGVKGADKVPWLYLDEISSQGFMSRDPIGFIVKKTKDALIDEVFGSTENGESGKLWKR